MTNQQHELSGYKEQFLNNIANKLQIYPNICNKCLNSKTFN